MSTTPAAAPTTTTARRSNTRLYIIGAVIVLAVFGESTFF